MYSVIEQLHISRDYSSVITGIVIIFSACWLCAGGLKITTIIAVEPRQELGRRITAVTDDPRETGFLFQRLSVALQRGNAVSFRSTFTTE